MNDRMDTTRTARIVAWIRRRPGISASAGVAIVALAAIVLVWFQPQKLFIDNRVDEELPGLSTADDQSGAAMDDDMADGEMTDEAMSDEGMADEGMADESMGSDEDMAEPMSDESMSEDDMAGDDMAGSGDEETGDEPIESETSEDAAATNETAESTGPVILRRGTFQSHDHPTSGEALFVRLEDGSRVLRIEDLQTDNGPDLNVYLSSAPADASAGELGSDYVDLGDLKGNIGSQNYEIPAEVDIDRYSTVVIWCVRFSVAFGAAGTA